MDAHTASDLINSLHFMPGWEFRARTLPAMWPGEPEVVRAELLIDTVNSDREDALLGYPEKITVAPSMTFYPGEVKSKEELYAGLLIWARECWTHEAREFLRVGDDMQAPFHPHKETGEVAWNAALKTLGA